jgi:poly [ADP-ribose] polymerase 6/8
MRWHSILRNGLKNATGTRLQANGAAHGEGIYFARSSSTSWGYAVPANNNYSRSELGRSLQIISLCEIAKVPSQKTTIPVKLRSMGARDETLKFTGFLKDHGWAHTLSVEPACIARFMFVGGNFNRDVVQNPPGKVPKLRDVLNFHAGAGQRK